MNTDLIKIETLSPEEIDFYTEKLLAVRQSNLERKLKLMEEKQKATEEMFNLKINQVNTLVNKIEENSEKKLEVAVNSMRVKEPKYGFVNQGDFGRFFTISIGSKTMGKLLRIVGLAMKAKNQTTPYRELIPKYAMTEAYENYTAVKWNYEKCLEFVDRWLKENDYFETFYSIGSTQDMEKFITNLYEKCRGGRG